jgi:predicted nucleotide-binding protein
MFDRPTKGDIDRALSTLMHGARHQLAARRNEAMAEATKAGALQNSRLIVVVAEAAEKIHVEAMQQTMSVLREFVQRMDVAPSQITGWAHPHLENLGNTLLEVIPTCGFPDANKRIVAQYKAQFDQRMTGALRDVEIGFVNGGGFVGMLEQDEWIRAAEAVAMLKPILAEYSARPRICERAHGGLIRARAEQFHFGKRKFHNHDIPEVFWWAEGHQRLEQDWAAGDFSTWIERGSVQLKAFGVTFARADIQKLLPPASGAPRPPATAAKSLKGDNIVIGHGRSLLWHTLKDFVKDRLHLPVDEFNSVPTAGITTVARLSSMLDNAAFAFLIMTAEDEQADGKLRARENVVHEAGLFQGRLGFERAIILLEEGGGEFSNIHGLGQIRFPKGNIGAAFEEIRAVFEREGLTSRYRHERLIREFKARARVGGRDAAAAARWPVVQS